MPPVANGISPAPDALAKRIAHYRRTFTRGLGHKTSGVQSNAVMHAAILTARAELAALDPAVTLNDLVRLSNEARRARADMTAALHPVVPETRPPSFNEIVEELANG